MPHKFAVFLLPILFVMVYLLPLSFRPLFDQDETRYAEVPREMVASGDWVVPRINGLRYFEKPVMGYWLTALSLKVFGENNFAVRFPSALSTGLVALLIFFLASFSMGQGTPLPWLAVVVYLTSLGVTAIGTFAVLDAPLTLFLTAALAAFFLATEHLPGTPKERALLFVAGLLAGCAFLIKGFLAFAVPVLVAGPFLLLQGRWRDLLRMLWLPLAGVVTVSLPWAILIHQREPDFWHYFFWTEHVHRFFSPSAQHTQPLWFFLAVLPAMFMPWTLLLPASWTGLMKTQWPAGPQKRRALFCLCWFLFPLLFFSASSGKLVTYILPCFPPLAILTAQGLITVTRSFKVKKSVQYGIIILTALAAVTCIALIGLQLIDPEKLRLYNQPWQWIPLAGALVVMILLLLASMRAVGETQLMLYALSFSVLLFAAPFAMPAITLELKAPGAFFDRNKKNISPETIILVGEEMTRSACWFLKREDLFLVDRGGELQYGLNYADASHRKLTPAEAGDLVKKHGGKAVLFATQNDYRRLRFFMPLPVTLDVNSQGGFQAAFY